MADPTTVSATENRIVYNVTEIMKFLPHRYPFLLVDRIVEMDPPQRIVGLKNVTMNEEFFQGHFPGAPVMPGVLILEAMAQVAGVLLYREMPDEDKMQEAHLLYRSRERQVPPPGGAGRPVAHGNRVGVSPQ